jgi:hypothetical protein|nr:MAG TPA: hypothetical protein [Caudoviricetes sp.]
MRFDDIMTIAEASERFGRAASTLKQACLSGRLVEGEECRKSGGVLLVTKQGMERLYGKEQPKQAYYFAELQNAGSYRQAEKLKATSLRAAKREASMRQVFQGTTLEIGNSVNEDGFILNPIARKEVGKHWEDIV